MLVLYQMAMIHCYECGEKISESAKSCPKCGAEQKHNLVSSQKNKTTAGLFALFLGGIGIHKFYLGKTGLGFVYLIFFWTFIPALIAFVEAILFFTMKDEEFNKKYLEK